MLKICLVFWESEPQYAYKLHAYKKKTCIGFFSWIRLVNMMPEIYYKVTI